MQRTSSARASRLALVHDREPRRAASLTRVSRNPALRRPPARPPCLARFAPRRPSPAHSPDLFSYAPTGSGCCASISGASSTDATSSCRGCVRAAPGRSSMSRRALASRACRSVLWFEGPPSIWSRPSSFWSLAAPRAGPPLPRARLLLRFAPWPRCCRGPVHAVATVCRRSPHSRGRRSGCRFAIAMSPREPAGPEPLWSGRPTSRTSSREQVPPVLRPHFAGAGQAAQRPGHNGASIR